jgi:hypothetical protein
MKLESEVSEKVSKCYNKCQDALLAVLIAKGSVTEVPYVTNYAIRFIGTGAACRSFPWCLGTCH